MSNEPPGTFDSPDAAASGQFISGLLQAQFPPLPYKRFIRNIQVLCSETTSVAIYLDAITPSAQIAQDNNGFNNTWGPVNLRPIPINSIIIVVWPDATAPASASAVIAAGGLVEGVRFY